MKVPRFWIKEELLVNEEASMDVSSQPGTVCVVRVDDVIKMLASLGDGAWRKHVRDPLPEQWEPPMSPCDPMPQPYEITKSPCDPPPDQWEPPIKVVS